MRGGEQRRREGEREGEGEGEGEIEKERGREGKRGSSAQRNLAKEANRNCNVYSR